MLVSWAVVILVTTSTHSLSDNGIELEIETEFDALVDLNSIELLDSNEREYRLSVFTVNCVAESIASIIYPGEEREDGRVCPGITVDSIYTEEELDLMNGAVLDSRVEPADTPALARIAKRQIAEAPSSYDVRDFVTLSTPTHQGLCGNCYVHTFVSSLEIAYAKQTGTLLNLSRQELTDCFYKGCNGGDFRALAYMVAITDHLSEAANYGPYLAQHTRRRFACKAAVTPDSLIDIKVLGFYPVTANTLDYHVYKYGSVMACLDWKGGDDNNCGLVSFVKTEVFEGDEVAGGCNHAVLIVGYTPDYYIAKNSHGVSWGDGGYFRIKRGTNACGIEDDMAVIITEPRSSPKDGLAANKCPADHPHYCPSSKSCTSQEDCIAPIEHGNTIRRTRSIWNLKRRIGSSSYAGKLRSWKFLANNRKPSCRDSSSSARCGTLKELGFCENDLSFRDVECRKTCGVCSDNSAGGSSGCVDSSSTCPQFTSTVCKMVYRIRKNCPATCNACRITDPSQHETAVNWNPDQPTGPCPAPHIPHGQVVLAPGTSQLNHGEALVVSCESGYALKGETVSCVIQDVFKPDSRLLPQCVKIGSEVLHGNGSDYHGSRDVTVSGKPCLNWVKEVIAGSTFVRPDEAHQLMNGNHNYCRNKGGSKGVPYCLVDNRLHSVERGMSLVARDFTGPDVQTEFCFRHPGCDVCGTGVEDSSGASCSQHAQSGDCDFRRSSTWKIQEYWWTFCRVSCCAQSDCANYTG